jgi:RNA recognition motif-containing protein
VLLPITPFYSHLTSGPTGNSIFVSDAARKKSLHDPNKVFLGNLNWNVTALELKTLCRRFGDVAHVKVVKNHYTGNSKGIAFVRFCDPISATAALTTLNGLELYGRLIVCDNVEEKPKLTKKQRKLADKIAGWDAAKVAGEGGFDLEDVLLAGTEQAGGEDQDEDDEQVEEIDEEEGERVANE